MLFRLSGGVMAEPFAQRVVHARLPSFAGCSESLDDVGVVSDRERDLRMVELRPSAASFHPIELTVGGDQGVRVLVDAALSYCAASRYSPGAYISSSFSVTPLVQPKPSCSGYSPPPPPPALGPSTTYFSTNLCSDA